MTVTDELETAFADALDDLDADRLTRRVKTLVSDELAALGTRVDIRHTDYFNHTFVPDMVVAWDDAGDRHQRDVFLRFEMASASVAADVERLADRRDSAFIGIRTRRGDGDALAAVTSAAANTPMALVTEASALGALRPRSHRPFSGVISDAFIRAGKGVVDRFRASELEDQAGRAYEAATSHAEEPLGKALQVLRRSLQQDAAVRVEHFLQFMWVGYGGDLEEFPGDPSLGTIVFGTELSRLLDQVLSGPEIEEPAFWRLLSDHLALERLEELGDVASSENLQRLLGSAADRVKAHVMATARTGGELPLEMPFRWAIKDGLVQLADHEFTLRFAKDRRRFRGVPADQAAPRLTSVRGRLTGMTLSEMDISTSDLDMDVRAKGAPRAADDPMFAELPDDSRVRRVRFPTPSSGQYLQADFERRMVDTVDDDPPLALREVAIAGYRALYESSKSTLTRLDRALAPSKSSEAEADDEGPDDED